MRERIDTNNGILTVGNLLNSPFGVGPKDYDVYLPGDMDQKDLLYAEFLLNHPHPKVRLYFTRKDLRGRCNYPFVSSQ